MPKSNRIISRTEITVPANALRLGELCPHYGGHYAGLMLGDTGQQWHIFGSPVETDIDAVAFGEYGKDVAGARSRNDGLANTTALLAAGDHPAAKACAAVNAHGLTDWYLPAAAELALCEANLRNLFKPALYWSSTQYSAYSAWCQNFNYGYQDINLKDFKLRARAVRRLVIQ